MPRRVPKSPQAVLSEAQTAVIQSFAFSDFTPFEALIGRALSTVEQGALSALAKRYLCAKAIETNSPTVAAIKKRLGNVKKTAGALRKALTATDTNSADFFAAREISEWLRDRPFSRRIIGRVDANAVALLMRDLERACERASRSSVHPQELPPSWLRFMHDLEGWAQSAGMAATVSKRLQGKGGRLKPSPFVALVKASQAAFPAAYREHTQSDDALSTAVSNALRVVKPSKS
jgi:hypothetical protein